MGRKGEILEILSRFVQKRVAINAFNPREGRW